MINIGDKFKWAYKGAEFEVIGLETRVVKYIYISGDIEGQVFTCGEGTLEHYIEQGHLVKVETKKTEISDKATRYNEGKTDWSQVSFKALEPMVRVLMFGASKYGKENWKKGHERHELLNSTQRHLSALFDGEENDNESKLSHAAHVMSNMMFYIYHYVIKKN